MEPDIEGRQERARATAPSSDASGQTKRLTVDIPKDLHRLLKVRAAEEDLTMAVLVRSLLESWVVRERD